MKKILLGLATVLLITGGAQAQQATRDRAAASTSDRVARQIRGLSIQIAARGEGVAPKQTETPRAMAEHAKGEPDQPMSGEKDRICRGILAANWSEGSADDAPDDGSRLIRADDITHSCLFHIASDIGTRILGACRMGFPCKVEARVNGVESDAYYILKVYSAHPMWPAAASH